MLFNTINYLLCTSFFSSKTGNKFKDCRILQKFVGKSRSKCSSTHTSERPAFSTMFVHAFFQIFNKEKKSALDKAKCSHKVDVGIRMFLQILRIPLSKIDRRRRAEPPREREPRVELTCIGSPGSGCGGSCLIGLVASRSGGSGPLGVRGSGRRRGHRVARLPGLVCGGAGRPVREESVRQNFHGRHAAGPREASARGFATAGEERREGSREARAAPSGRGRSTEMPISRAAESNGRRAGWAPLRRRAVVGRQDQFFSLPRARASRGGESSRGLTLDT